MAIQKTEQFHNRSREQIIYRVLILLSESKTPILKTKIMNHTYMSYTQSKQYISIMIENELIEESDDGYIITPKGRQYLEAYGIISDLLKFN